MELSQEVTQKELKIKHLEEQLSATQSSLKLETHRNSALEEALKERDKTYKEISENNLGTIETLKKVIIYINCIFFYNQTLSQKILMTPFLRNIIFPPL